MSIGYKPLETSDVTW